MSLRSSPLRFLRMRLGVVVQLFLVYLVFVGTTFLPSSRGFGGNAAAMFGSLMLFSITVGVAAMAVIETLKRLIPIRGLYQLRQIQSWLGRSAFLDLAHALGGPSERELLDMFNLPIEQICAQISNALDLALATPRLHRHLVSRMASDSWYDEEREESDETRQFERNHSVRSALNVLQISVGQRWRWQVRMTAYWMSGLLGLLVVAFADVAPLARKEFALAALAFGGFFAWLARDVAALLERLRR